LPEVIAPMRAKLVPITVNTALRYLMASSGFWNWAAAGSATVAAASVRAARENRFMPGLRLKSGCLLRQPSGGDLTRHPRGECTHWRQTLPL
jgi:hypothetical protein